MAFSKDFLMEQKEKLLKHKMRVMNTMKENYHTEVIAQTEDTIEDGSFTEPVPTTQNRTSFSDLLMQTHESHSHSKHDDSHHGDHDADHHGEDKHSGGHE